MSKLIILTLNWNGAEKLKALAPTLFNSLSGIDFEWLVKDNNSNDDSVEYLKTLGNKVNPIPYKDNLQNFSQGMNYLFQVVSPKDNDLILLLNNDIVFNDKQSLKNMISLMNDDEVGAVGAKLTYPNSNKLQHAGVVRNKIHGTPIHYRWHQESDIHAEMNREFQSVTGAVLLTRADIFKNANKGKGFDNNYNWAFDDTDLTLSIKYELQKKIVYCGKTNISHEESATLKKNPANRLFLHHNINYFKSKWDKRFVFDQELYEKNSQYNLYQK